MQWPTKTREHAAADTVLAYRVDYRSAAAHVLRLPVSDLVNEQGEPMYGPDSLEGDTHRIVEVFMHDRQDPRMPDFSTELIGASNFSPCYPAMPATFNPERPRGVDREGKTLAVQCDILDMVMINAIYGRILTQHEVHHLCMGDLVHIRYKNQEKTIFERVEDEVKRRKDANEEPCCRDYSNEGNSGGFIWL